MKRIWLAWLVFGLCAGAMLAIMGWGTHKLIELDAHERKVREADALEENVRLSLWRMETALAPIVVQENSRPYTAYFVAGQHQRRAEGDSLVGPGTPVSPYVKLHFQLDQNSRFSAVSVVGSHRIENLPNTIANLRDPAALSTLTSAIPATWIQVEQSTQGVTPVMVAKAETPPSTPTSSRNTPTVSNSLDLSRTTAQIQSAEPVQSVDTQQRLASQPQANVSQMASNYREFEARGMLNSNNAFVSQRPDLQLGPQRPLTSSKKGVTNRRTVEIKTGVLAPFWVNNDLILARRVQVGTSEIVQGCWIDLPNVRTSLLTSIDDLLPGSDLIPERGPFDPAEGRTLTSLPLRLVPGRVQSTALEEPSPVLFPLKIAWSCMIVAIIAVGLLFMGAISLSQRRAAFVSSVTHELRTPLTTFRMYTEMLVEGMATDPVKMSQYHQTLYRESGRLIHLVENVLSYARLEKGRYGDKEEISIGELIHRTHDRLAEHAKLSDMQLLVSFEPTDGEKIVQVDTSAIERILFNLVDNACKYARSARDRRIHIDVSSEKQLAQITVRDHGPGIDRGSSRRLFKPFRKTATDAARSAPGVGIGLALSRRLAKVAGGRLVVVPSNEGACLCLYLPIQATHTDV